MSINPYLVHLNANSDRPFPEQLVEDLAVTVRNIFMQSDVPVEFNTATIIHEVYCWYFKEQTTEEKQQRFDENPEYRLEIAVNVMDDYLSDDSERTFCSDGTDDYEDDELVDD
tara:strand:+ start:5629 stop:5967 length:339 start_codon:yes stop_codon:yes gene_type:complete